MIYIISVISSVLSGLGVGGGGLFVLLSMLFNITNINTLRAYNLIIFIFLGIIIAIKNNNIILNNKKMYFKALFCIIIGSILGCFLGKFIPEKVIKISFNLFMLLIGLYEIIASIITMKNVKNNTMKGE